jgi:hypothetical protein
MGFVGNFSAAATMAGMTKHKQRIINGIIFFLISLLLLLKKSYMIRF